MQEAGPGSEPHSDFGLHVLSHAAFLSPTPKEWKRPFNKIQHFNQVIPRRFQMFRMDHCENSFGDRQKWFQVLTRLHTHSGNGRETPPAQVLHLTGSLWNEMWWHKLNVEHLIHQRGSAHVGSPLIISCLVIWSPEWMSPASGNERITLEAISPQENEDVDTSSMSLAW